MPNRETRCPCAGSIWAAVLSAIFVAFLGVVPGNASSPNESPPLAKPAPTSSAYQRQYKASAFITLFSIPISSRAVVGFGFADVDEQTHGSARSLSLRFWSGSTPERAHGLNRFGFMQEIVQQRDHTTTSVDYFGLLTASGEESLSDAKAALNSKPVDQVPFVAAHAIVNLDKTSYCVRHMLLPASYRGSDAAQLLQRLEAEFAAMPFDQMEKTDLRNGRVSTFLCSLSEAIQAGADSFESRIIFNGKTLRFQSTKRFDPKVGAELQRAGVTAVPAAIMQLNGTLRNEKTNELSSFRLWFERGAANFLPLRFEFKPKSYLRLVFDAEPPPQTLTMNRQLPQ